ncbi:MAG: hypothetical protein VR64_10005 [Desulfatitalea sp. BRH_c12]|nr:MAG: hypothetical protein VR64_10005 [Desulfatitalea sp. BRH_c12]
MKNRVLKALAIVGGLCVSFGCASGRPSAEPGAINTPAPTALAQPVPDAPQNELSAEDELLLDETFGLENGNSFYTVADPLEPVNRAMFVFNDKLYFWVMKPVAEGYRFVTPTPVRSGVRNFFHNLGAPVRIVNNVLQGKGRAAEAEWTRFLYNTTVGILGFGNPAARYPELNVSPEDLGQTLAVYGIGDGFFLMWPILGASTLRDTAGMGGDRFLNPIGYVDPFELSLGLSGYDKINTLSFRIGDYESLKDAALDPYASFRDAYIQLRQSKIKQ